MTTVTVQPSDQEIKTRREQRFRSGREASPMARELIVLQRFESRSAASGPDIHVIRRYRSLGGWYT